MLGNISHSSIHILRRRPAECQPLAMLVAVPFKEQLHYSTIFSTVKSRVLKFTNHPMNVHDWVTDNPPEQFFNGLIGFTHQAGRL